MIISANGLEGVIMEMTEKQTKEGEKVINALIFQEGEKQLTTVRMTKEQANECSVGQKVSVFGRVLGWKQREGIGMMLLAKEVVA